MLAYVITHPVKTGRPLLESVDNWQLVDNFNICKMTAKRTPFWL